jgi:hypothetical protein
MDSDSLQPQLPLQTTKAIAAAKEISVGSARRTISGQPGNNHSVSFKSQ